MTAYYNEIDEYAADWLRNLIAAKLIADGEVDEGSIVDVQASDLKGFTQCHFFAGIGGWPYALRVAGWPDDRPVWTGSCPCQPFSLAGAQKGFADERHLWPEFRRLIKIEKPTTVFGEQVASAAKWLGLVRSDLEALGYAVGAMPVEAASAGADHLRDRYWFAGSQGRRLLPERAGERAARSNGVADTNIMRKGEGRIQRSGEQRGAGSDPQARSLVNAASNGWGEGRPEHEVRSRRSTVAEPSGTKLLADAERERSLSGAHAGIHRVEESTRPRHVDAERHGDTHDWVFGADGKARRVKPGVRLLAHGIPNRVAKLRAFGNAIDPRPAAAFIEACSEIVS